MGWYSVSSESEGGEGEWGVWGAGGEVVKGCGGAGGGLGLSAIFPSLRWEIEFDSFVVGGSQDMYVEA